MQETDTPNEGSDEALREELARVDSLEGLVLVGGSPRHRR
jgi:hypothetical protein